MILPGLIRDKGYDYSAIQVVFSNMGLSRHIRTLYFELCIAIIDIIHKKRMSAQSGEKVCNEKKREECELMFGKENMEWTCKNCEENKDPDRLKVADDLHVTTG